MSSHIIVRVVEVQGVDDVLHSADKEFWDSNPGHVRTRLVVEVPEVPSTRLAHSMSLGGMAMRHCNGEASSNSEADAQPK